MKFKNELNKTIPLVQTLNTWWLRCRRPHKWKQSRRKRRAFAWLLATQEHQLGIETEHCTQTSQCICKKRDTIFNYRLRKNICGIKNTRLEATHPKQWPTCWLPPVGFLKQAPMCFVLILFFFFNCAVEWKWAPWKLSALLFVIIHTRDGRSPFFSTREVIVNFFLDGLVEDPASKQLWRRFISNSARNLPIGA